MGARELTAETQQRASGLRRRWRAHGIREVIKVLTTAVTMLVGLGLLALGGWILALRTEGAVDFFRPRSLSIGQVTVNGAEAKQYAELLRARFDHYFRHPAPIPSETGFLDVVTLDAPELFRPKVLRDAATNVKFEVSGVDVGKVAQVVNDLAKPPEWLLDADFQTRPDRGVLALRLRRGAQVIRTWYVERTKGASDEASLVERLTDDAIFQLVFEFWTAPEGGELGKWKSVLPQPTTGRSPDIFPSVAAVAAYYEALGALGRYYAGGDWRDLDVAVEALRTVRLQMPDYADGLQLLGMALAEKREEGEAIHVYEQLTHLLDARDARAGDQERRRLSVDLLKATAMTRLYTWQSAHDAVRELDALVERLRGALARDGEREPRRRAALQELLAHSHVQLAYAYALYLDYLRHFTVFDVFGAPSSPITLTADELEDLKPHKNKSRPVVLKVVRELAERHRKALDVAKGLSAELDRELPRACTGVQQHENGTSPCPASGWQMLKDWKRRRAELHSRRFFASGYGHTRMAEWERSASENDARQVFEPSMGTFESHLEQAKKDLRAADELHPNHYLVLQLLGLTCSAPRDSRADLRIATQYFERSIRANPFDATGHELLSGILLRTVSTHGLDTASKEIIAKGLAEAQEAIRRRNRSFAAQLFRTRHQTLLILLERDPDSRRRLRADLELYRNQVERDYPKVFGMTQPELLWVDVVSEIRRASEHAEALESTGAKRADVVAGRERFQRASARASELTRELVKACAWWQEHWVPNQRVFDITEVRREAEALQRALEHASEETWNRVPLPVP